jgi:hypothetical protein
LGTRGFPIDILIGNIVEVSGLPGKVLAPYPKIGR